MSQSNPAQHDKLHKVFDAISKCDYDAVDVAIRLHLENHRDRARAWVDWTTQMAQAGHVVAAYHSARNILKPSSGVVLDTSSFEKGLRMILFLLLRIAQDLYACERAFGDSINSDIFDLTRDKCMGWLRRHGPPSEWPPMPPIVNKLKTVEAGSLPSIAWLYDTKTPTIFRGWGGWGSEHIQFGSGNTAKHNAFIRNPSGVTTERNRITKAFINALDGADWEMLGRLQLKDLNLVPLSSPPPLVVVTSPPPSAPPLKNTCVKSADEVFDQPAPNYTEW